MREFIDAYVNGEEVLSVTVNNLLGAGVDEQKLKEVVWVMLITENDEHLWTLLD